MFFLHLTAFLGLLVLNLIFLLGQRISFKLKVKLIYDLLLLTLNFLFQFFLDFVSAICVRNYLLDINKIPPVSSLRMVSAFSVLINGWSFHLHIGLLCLHIFIKNCNLQPLEEFYADPFGEY
jgi:hypothetical protein